MMRFCYTIAIPISATNKRFLSSNCLLKDTVRLPSISQSKSRHTESHIANMLSIPNTLGFLVSLCFVRIQIWILRIVNIVKFYNITLPWVLRTISEPEPQPPALFRQSECSFISVIEPSSHLAIIRICVELKWRHSETNIYLFECHHSHEWG